MAVGHVVKPVMVKLAMDGALASARCVDARLTDRIAREKGLNVAAMHKGGCGVWGNRDSKPLGWSM